MGFDLLFKGGHVIDPSQGLDAMIDVGITQGRISAIGVDLPATDGLQVKDARGSYLCPGLVDLHGHWYEGDLYGIDPRICLDHGVTTAVDAGPLVTPISPRSVKRQSTTARSTSSPSFISPLWGCSLSLPRNC